MTIKKQQTKKKNKNKKTAKKILPNVKKHQRDKQQITKIEKQQEINNLHLFF